MAALVALKAAINKMNFLFGYVTKLIANKKQISNYNHIKLSADFLRKADIK